MICVMSTLIVKSIGGKKKLGLTPKKRDLQSFTLVISCIKFVI